MIATDDHPVRILVAPCGCVAGIDLTDDFPGFCRTNDEAAEDLHAGFREHQTTLAQARTKVCDCAHEPKWGTTEPATTP